VSADVVDQLARASGLAVVSRAAVAASWAALLVEARAAWPNVAFDEATIAEFVGARLVGEDLDRALASAPRADLALAGACAAGDKAAHAALDGLLSAIDHARAPRDVVDEVKQVLRVQLLVAKDGKPPGIASYRGRGALRGWLRITATRELIRHVKHQPRTVPLERSLDEAIVKIDPALDALKAEYRSEFAIALREAIAELTADDRTLLRQSIVDAMSIDEIGAAFGVHRATAARWLSRARGALVSTTHRRLAERLAMPVDQIASVIRLVQSKLEASVVRYLRDDDDADAGS
jgi:RNA polymerase sigma-70 factor (ECF subfamily)